jgi:hypothetical protein
VATPDASSRLPLLTLNSRPVTRCHPSTSTPPKPWAGGLRVQGPLRHVGLKIPKLRKCSFFPSILERRRRIDRALFAVVMEAYVHA